jgi:hypothetical protein
MVVTKFRITPIGIPTIRRIPVLLVPVLVVVLVTVILSGRRTTQSPRVVVVVVAVVVSFHLQPPLLVLPVRRHNQHTAVVVSPSILFSGSEVNSNDEKVVESGVMIPISSKTSIVDHSMNRHRRDLIRNVIVAMLISPIATNTNMVSAAKTSSSSSSSSSGYVRGAAELDLEYYLRDLLGNQNERIGNIQPSLPPPIQPPRTILNPLLDLLLNDALSYSSSSRTTNQGNNGNSNSCCCTIRALIDTIQKQERENPATTTTMTTTRTTTAEIQASIIQYRDRVQTSFYQRAAWNQTTVSDQYYFDMISYTIWKTAGNYLPSSLQRSQFVSTLGQYIYQSLLQQQLISIVTPLSKDSQQHPLTSTNQYVRDILNLFTKCGFIQSYRIGSGSSGTTSTANDNNLFDTYDDEALLNQSTIDVLISIYESATLGASLQLTGEQSRFLPDYIGPTLMAMWYDTIQSTTNNGQLLSITYETYFLDSTYRPNPKGNVTMFNDSCVVCPPLILATIS